MVVVCRWKKKYNFNFFIDPLNRTYGIGGGAPITPLKLEASPYLPHMGLRPITPI